MADAVLGYAASEDAARLDGSTHRVGSRVVAALAPAGLSAAQFHRHVVARCRATAFLPARIGLLADDRWQALSSAHEPNIAAAVAAFGQRVEVAVVVQLPPAAPVAGRRYLAARVAEDDALAACGATLAAVAERHDGQLRTTRRSRGFDGALLLKRAAVANAVADLEHIARARHSGVTMTVSGPWPPYRFAAAALPELS